LKGINGECVSNNMKGGLYSSVLACGRQARYRFAQTRTSEGDTIGGLYSSDPACGRQARYRFAQTSIHVK